MKVSRRHGRLRLRLEEHEVHLLSGLLDELSTLLAESDSDAASGDPVVQRLFPSAYPDDVDADADFRSITESSLRDDRLERIGACTAELVRDGEIDLSDADAARRWIQVLNDLRLSLGTRIGVTEDERDLDPSDPENQPWLVYYWLTAVQDSVVTSLMR